MANIDLAVRFTENNYATKSEVSKELKISVIDGVWDKILSYRSPFYHYLSIKNVDKNQFRVCLCPTISNKVNTADAKLVRLLNEFNKLNPVNRDSNYFEQECLIKCLQNIAIKDNYTSDEEQMREVIRGNGNRDLSNYLEALRYIKKRHVNSIDIDFLADLYSAVTNNSELTYFYRDYDGDELSNSVISRVYKFAPHQLIEQMMNGLFSFIDHSNLSPISVALISYYYISFVQPFKNFNEQIAVLIAKSVLAHSSVGEFAIYLPFESLLNEPVLEVSKRFHEVQQTSDVTYYFAYAIECANHYLDKMLDNIAEYSTTVIKNDFFQLDDLKAEEKVEEESTPVKEGKSEVVVPKEEIVEEKVEKVEEVNSQPKGLAVSYIPEELDEKAASRLEKHLLEMDPRLKKGQAHFYARHCTLGMFYTIEQYRKSERCVYETARTSMDKLAEYGYYEKKEFGKKYVYTPVDRK